MSESLNLQFCSTAVNYDIPWNPVPAAEWTGLIDPLGQPVNNSHVNVLTSILPNAYHRNSQNIDSKDPT